MKYLYIVLGISVLIGLFFIIKLSLKKEPLKNSTVDRCIITVNGQQYDVTDFRKMHPGGDVFICGTDMTNTFIKQHGQDFERLKKLKKV